MEGFVIRVGSIRDPSTPLRFAQDDDVYEKTEWKGVILKAEGLKDLVRSVGDPSTPLRSAQDDRGFGWSA